MRYSTAAAFRDALEHRLNLRATERQIAVNVLRKQVAIDRFLARLAVVAPGRWVVKGAYAIDLRLGSRGRATRDVDLERSDDAAAALHDMRDASSADVGDYFRFGVERSRQRIPGDHNRGSRFLVAADLAGRRFDTFTVDVAFGELLVDVPDLIEGPDLLAFAGIPRSRAFPPSRSNSRSLRRCTPTRASTEVGGATRASRTSSTWRISLGCPRWMARNFARPCAGHSQRAAPTNCQLNCRFRRRNGRCRTGCSRGRSVFRRSLLRRTASLSL